MKLAHAENIQVRPLLAPQDITSTETQTSWIDMDYLTGLIEFEVNVGTITSTDTTGSLTITILASTAGSTSDTNTAIAFYYMSSGAVDTGTMSTIAAATSSGITVGPTEDNITVLCYADPAVAGAAMTDAKFLNMNLAPTSDYTATLVSVVARATMRYAAQGGSQLSST
jgi:hypothetical protein